MEAAMETVHDKYEFRVRWLPFLLRPDMPPEGVEKPPASAGNPRVGGRLKNAGSEVGIDFTGKCDRAPNTIASHALLEHTLEKYGHQKQNELSEAIFQAYFTDGISPSPKNLGHIAKSVGLDQDEAKNVSGDEDKQMQARENARDWKRKGCTGVPLYYMNGQRTFSGARDKDSFIQMFHMVAEKYPISS